MNISQDNNSQGVLVLTNVRIVWWNINQSNININIPYVSIKSIKKKDCEYGVMIVIEIL